MKKVISVLIVFCLVFVSAVTPVFADEVDDLNNEKAQLQQQKTQIDKELKALRGKIENEEAYQQTLKKKIDIIHAEISALEANISALNSSITKKNKEIAEKEKEIEETTKTLKARLRAQYLTGETSSLEALLGAKDFGEFLSNVEIIKRMTQHDKQLIDKYHETKELIISERKSLEENKASLETSRADINARQQELISAYSETAENLKGLKEEEAYFTKNYKEVNKYINDIEDEINSLLPPPGTNPSYDDEKFVWPLPGYPTITSNYGMRWGAMHTGIDISGGGVHGKPIIASKSGKVIIATASTPSAYWGFGTFVLLDHGNGISTLYAHMSRLGTSAGTTVKQGQVIGYVGNTGNSFGSHLHFEVRVNGKPTNPLYSPGNVKYGN